MACKKFLYPLKICEPIFENIVDGYAAKCVAVQSTDNVITNFNSIAIVKYVYSYLS